MKQEVVYLIGSLRNPKVLEVTNALTKAGFEVFSDWFAASENADDAWRDYEKGRGRTYTQAINGFAAKHVFAFDKYHLDRSTMGVLLMPAGKSGHLELGYLSGQGKPTFIYFDEEPERWDVMYQFAKGGIHFSLDSLVYAMCHFNKEVDKQLC